VFIDRVGFVENECSMKILSIDVLHPKMVIFRDVPFPLVMCQIVFFFFRFIEEDN